MKHATTLNEGIRKAIRSDFPVTMFGLTFYPISVADYEKFAAMRDSLTLMQQSLGGRYVSLPYVSALYALDFDRTVLGAQTTGIFAKFVLLMYMALRLDIKSNLPEIHVDENDPSRLVSLTITQGTEAQTITARQLTRVRALLAEQNGVELPDESYNAELVEAEQDIANQANAAAALDYDYDSLVASVAYNMGLRIKDILDWSIREFELMRVAIDRNKRYELCMAAEYNGTKFQNGNPCPSWCYPRSERSSAVISVAEWQNSLSAVDKSGKLPQGLPTA